LEGRQLLAVTVDTLVDEVDGSLVDGDISLRDAIVIAAPGEMIDFSPSLNGGVINLTVALQELDIAKSLTIDASALPNGLTIDASAADPTPGQNNGDGSRVLNVDDGSDAVITVALIGLTLIGGDVTGPGGGIRSLEDLTLMRSTVTGNHAFITAPDAPYEGDGGGIWSNGGSLTISHSTIRANVSGDDGGGIKSNVRTTISNSMISGNAAGDVAGGIQSTRGIHISQTDIVDNTAQSDGGGIQADIIGTDGNTTIEASRITGNSSGRDGGGILARTSQTGGTVTISGSTISQNMAAGVGGGILSLALAVGNVSIANNTISDNAAGTNGGGITLFAIENGTATMTGSTVSENSAAEGGGGVLIEAADEAGITITGGTITGNSSDVDGGGLEVHAFDAGTVTIDAATIADNMADEDGGGVLAIATDEGTVTIMASTIEGNSATDDGGGIFMQSGLVTQTDQFAGTLTVSGNTIMGNSSTDAGGGIASVAVSDSTTSIVNNAITDNTAGSDGGGVAAQAEDESQLTFSGNTISGNTAVGIGGGVLALAFDDATATLTGLTIADNEADVDGGGMFVQTAQNASTTMSSSKVIENTAGADGGGIFVLAQVSGETTIHSIMVSDNIAGDDGGGMTLFADDDSEVTLTGSTVSNNAANSAGPGQDQAPVSGGGGLTILTNLNGAVTLTSATISGNTTSRDGGGVLALDVGSSIDMVHTTITRNAADTDSNGIGVGGGVHEVGAGAFRLNHAIIAENTRGGTADDVNGEASGAFNLVGVDVGVLGITSGTDNNQIGTAGSPIDVKLAALADNGGPTLPDGTKILTHSLLPGSPAIDAGDPSAVAGMGSVPIYDQRGNPFTRIVDSGSGQRIDIGALELQPPPAAFGDYNQDGATDASDYVVWRNTLASTSAPFAGADGDGDGTIDQDDLGVWRANFGRISAAVSRAESTPQATATSSSVEDAEPQTVLVFPSRPGRMGLSSFARQFVDSPIVAEPSSDTHSPDDPHALLVVANHRLASDTRLAEFSALSTTEEVSESGNRRLTHADHDRHSPQIAALDAFFASLELRIAR
jgi:hypothetical protein